MRKGAGRIESDWGCTVSAGRMASIQPMPDTVIDQSSIHVEHYVKTAANQWLLSEYDDPQVRLSLRAFSAQIDIIALYENIEIDP